ncbi:MAG: hypothetical protein ACYTGV_10805 [Planctomycetota bacterium]|jgi:hypothetical protein
MDVERFLSHHGITENPFGAEEARHDPVFERLTGRDGRSHPEFTKILGCVDRPQSSVVFGEKGSGKTALRLMMGKAVAEHNEGQPGRRTLLVPYDDFNPVLDLVARNRSRSSSRVARDPDRLLAAFRLEDHQDAILARGVSKLVDALLGETGGEEPMTLPAHFQERLTRLPRRRRVDIAVLAALYDTPRGGADLLERWRRLRKRLRLGWRLPFVFLGMAAVLLSVVAVGLLLAPTAVDFFRLESVSVPDWLLPAAGVAAAAAILLWGVWLWRRIRIWGLSRRILKAGPALDRSRAQLRRVLRDLKPADRAYQPWPRPGGDGTNARYELTQKLLGVLEGFDHKGIIVLVDRVDEPTIISGRPERMRRFIWPMLDSKYLQQDQIGVKLLLPLDLRYLIQKEDAAFFEAARLDKQNLVDRLAWSGATLYDLCTDRLRACRDEGDDEIHLTALFDQDVPRETLVEALGQMGQPRDAFKLLYAVIREHCQISTAEEAVYRIPRLTLEAVRRKQVQRIQELRQGLAPA